MIACLGGGASIDDYDDLPVNLNAGILWYAFKLPVLTDDGLGGPLLAQMSSQKSFMANITARHHGGERGEVAGSVKPHAWAVITTDPLADGMTMRKPLTPPRTFTAADAHALADRLDRNQRPQGDQAMAAKLIRALLAGRAAGDVITLQDE